MNEKETQQPIGVVSDLNNELGVLRQKHAKYFKENGYRAYSDAFNHVIVNHQGQEYGFDLACAVQLLTDLNYAIQIAAKTNDRYLK